MGFIAIFGAAVAGYAGLPVSVVLIAAGALFLMSLAHHDWLYAEAQRAGLRRTTAAVMALSALNGLVATGAAFGAGWLLQVAV